MSALVHGDVTRETLGAAFEMHGALGPGFLESVYEEAMAHELALRLNFSKPSLEIKRICRKLQSA